MDLMRRHDLDISGVATAPGGAYQDVRVQGIGKVHGDIDCIRCDIEGVSQINGSVKAESVRIRGNAKVQGNVLADTITVEGKTNVSGTCEARQNLRIQGRVLVGGDVLGDVVTVDGYNAFDGDFRGRDIKVRGKIHVYKGVFAEDIFVEGTMRVGGSCEAETFRVDGTFSIAGMLNAGKVSVRLKRNSSVKEIGGEEIRVERGHGLRMFHRISRLTVETIEGDEIYIEHTTAKVIRGNKVTLGPETQVDLVEYHTEFHNPGHAKVGESKKT